MERPVFPPDFHRLGDVTVFQLPPTVHLCELPRPYKKDNLLSGEMASKDAALNHETALKVCNDFLLKKEPIFSHVMCWGWLLKQVRIFFFSVYSAGIY